MPGSVRFRAQLTNRDRGPLHRRSRQLVGHRAAQVIGLQGNGQEESLGPHPTGGKSFRERQVSRVLDGDQELLRDSLQTIAALVIGNSSHLFHSHHCTGDRLTRLHIADLSSEHPFAGRPIDKQRPDHQRQHQQQPKSCLRCYPHLARGLAAERPPAWTRLSTQVDSQL